MALGMAQEEWNTNLSPMELQEGTQQQQAIVLQGKLLEAALLQNVYLEQQLEKEKLLRHDVQTLRVKIDALLLETNSGMCTSLLKEFVSSSLN